CEALREGRLLAARALHIRLCDAARLYLAASRAARASLWTLERVVPGITSHMEERRRQFAPVLKVELAVLAAERAAASAAGGSARRPRQAQAVRTPGMPAAPGLQARSPRGPVPLRRRLAG